MRAWAQGNPCRGTRSEPDRRQPRSHATGELSERLIPVYDRVCAALGEAGIEPGGHNLLVMRGGPEGDVDIEVGILVSGPFTEVGDLIAAETRPRCTVPSWSVR